MSAGNQLQRVLGDYERAVRLRLEAEGFSAYHAHLGASDAMVLLGRELLHGEPMPPLESRAWYKRWHPDNRPPPRPPAPLEVAIDEVALFRELEAGQVIVPVLDWSLERTHYPDGRP